ncbi:MAG: hypothetical protein QOF53_4204 [Nocardioidaceae bacterium]|nr:hypothetical protein [Nocardioidaceae bacterium]
MAKSSKDRDRRAVIEQLRRDQQRAERRRTVVVISVCVVVALVIIALAAVPLLRQHKLASKDLASIGVSRAGAGCQALVKKPANGNQQHKPVGTVINYPDAPPAFGPHWPTPAPFSRKFYTAQDRPQLEYVVHNLEHGYNLLWYDDTIAKDSTQLTAVKAIAAKFTGTKLTNKFIALPWTPKDGKAFPKGAHVALTHWSAGGDPADTSKQQGVWQYCGKVSGQVVSTFVKDWPYTDSPEPLAL